MDWDNNAEPQKIADSLLPKKIWQRYRQHQVK